MILGAISIFHWIGPTKWRTYRLIARIFHVEAIVLWSACLLLLLIKLIVG